MLSSVNDLSLNLGLYIQMQTLYNLWLKLNDSTGDIATIYLNDYLLNFPFGGRGGFIVYIVRVASKVIR